MKRITALLLTAALMLSLTGCDMIDYRKAVRLYDSGSFSEAKEVFSEIEDYKDSAVFLKGCDYGIAKELSGQEKYEEAAEIFAELGDYEDSAELLKGCNYSIAKALYEQEKYEEAAELFTKLGDYEDSAELLKGCSYSIAKALYEQEKYEEAAEAFAELGNYEDSAELLKGCSYSIAKALYEQEKYEEAAKAFAELGNYEDSADLLKKCNYELAEKLFEAGDFQAAAEAFRELGDYGDSAEKLAEAEDRLILLQLPGEWVSDPIDISVYFGENFNLGMEITGQAESAGYFEFNDLVIIENLVITDDNRYVETFSEDALDKMAGTTISACAEGMKRMLEDEIAVTAEEAGITTEDVLEAYGVNDMNGLFAAIYGMDLETFCDKLVNQMLIDQFRGYQGGGNVNVKDGVVIFKSDVESLAEYSEEEDTITFLTMDGSSSDSDDSVPKMVFRRSGSGK